MSVLAEEQFGISTLAWHDRPPEWGVRRAHELGFACVDIGIIGTMATVDAQMLVDDAERVLAPIEQALEETGVAVASCNVRVHGEDEDQRRAQARALARAARRLGVRAGITIGHGDVDAPLAAIVAELAPLCETIAEEGVTPMVESHRGNFTQRIDQARALLEALPALRFTLDASHYLCQGLEPADWEPLLPATEHCHLRACRPGELVAAAEDCSPLVDAWLAQLAARGYRGAVVHECIRDEATGCRLHAMLRERAALRA